MREVTSIPRRTLRGRLLCWLGFHHWIKTGAITTVIPTGGALLVKRRHQPVLCERVGCTARRDEVYERLAETEGK